MKKVIFIGLILLINGVNAVHCSVIEDVQIGRNSLIGELFANGEISVGECGDIGMAAGVLAYPVDRMYTRDHLWVKVSGDYCTIGITDFLQEDLGDIVFADVFCEGEWFEINSTWGSIESIMAVYTLFMPVGGTVLEVNPIVQDAPQNLNSNPHETWIIKVKMDDISDIYTLMSSVEYEDFVAEWGM